MRITSLPTIEMLLEAAAGARATLARADSDMPVTAPEGTSAPRSGDEPADGSPGTPGARAHTPCGAVPRTASPRSDTQDDAGIVVHLRQAAPEGNPDHGRPAVKGVPDRDGAATLLREPVESAPRDDAPDHHGAQFPLRHEPEASVAGGALQPPSWPCVRMHERPETRPGAGGARLWSTTLRVCLPTLGPVAVSIGLAEPRSLSVTIAGTTMQTHAFVHARAAALAHALSARGLHLSSFSMPSGNAR